MQTREMITEEKLKAAFDLFDIDSNGRITLEEIKSMLGGAQIESNNEIWKEFMLEADRNGDGEISLDEFKDMMKKMFFKK